MERRVVPPGARRLTWLPCDESQPSDPGDGRCRQARGRGAHHGLTGDQQSSPRHRGDAGQGAAGHRHARLSQQHGGTNLGGWALAGARRDQRGVGVLWPVEAPVRHTGRSTTVGTQRRLRHPARGQRRANAFGPRPPTRCERRRRDHHRPGPRGRRCPRCHPPGGAVRRHDGHQRHLSLRQHRSGPGGAAGHRPPPGPGSRDGPPCAGPEGLARSRGPRRGLAAGAPRPETSHPACIARRLESRFGVPRRGGPLPIPMSPRSSSPTTR